MKRLLLLALSVLFALSIYAQVPILPPESGRFQDRKLENHHVDNFKFFTNCQPIDLVVSPLNRNAAEIGLTKNSIERLVRSRLRAAGIYGNESPFPYLKVHVIVVGLAFSHRMQFIKSVYDPLADNIGAAVTWDMGGAGTHGRDHQYITGTISEFTDQFIDEYLRVNADYCK